MRNIVVFNAESSYFFYRDYFYRQNVLNADYALCDSVSLSIVLRLLRIPHSRYHGPDFFENYLIRNPEESLAIVGGSDAAHLAIKEKFCLKKASFWSREVKPNSLGELIEFIDNSDAKAVFVCLGLRKQERVIDALIKHCRGLQNCELVIGVGAGIDFLGATKRRAGPMLRDLGLEWLPRLIREPRMFPRLVRSLLGCLLVLVNKRDFVATMNKFSMREND